MDLRGVKEVTLPVWEFKKYQSLQTQLAEAKEKLVVESNQRQVEEDLKKSFIKSFNEQLSEKVKLKAQLAESRAEVERLRAFERSWIQFDVSTVRKEAEELVNLQMENEKLREGIKSIRDSILNAPDGLMGEELATYITGFCIATADELLKGD